MKSLIAFVLMGLTATPVLYAQVPSSPVASSAREVFNRQSKFILAAVEEMPANKYSFRPTPSQLTFGKIIAHMVDVNQRVCAMIGNSPATGIPAVTETSSKEALDHSLKLSFDYCAKALGPLQDSSLGDTVTFFGNRKVPRARALLELNVDITDHYSQMAGYLRLNGLIPPSAQPSKK